MATVIANPAVDAASVVSEMVGRLASAVSPLRVVLFGSRARGDATPGSDVDLLVIVPNGSNVRDLEEQADMLLLGLPLAADIFVSTPTVIERYGHCVTSVVRHALTEGRVVHDRTPPAPSVERATAACLRRMTSMTPYDPYTQEEALEWLEDASVSLELASTLSRRGQRYAGPSCFHSQQAAEHSLKAVLALENILFKPTHNLVNLRIAVREALSGRWEERTDDGSLRQLAKWSTYGRYGVRARRATPEDAQQSVAIAQVIYDQAEAAFVRRNVSPDSSADPPEPPGMDC